MNNKIIKRDAKQSFKKNYWRIIAVTFFVSIIIGNFSINTPSFNYHSIPLLNSINLDIAKETLESITKIKISILSYKPTRGIFANIFNNITASGSFIFGLLNSFNQLFFHERIWASLIILIGAIITFLYWLFIKNVLLVGQARFFLENKNHPKTNFKRILLPFKIKKTKEISFTMMKVTLLEWLWWLTIIGGIIKHYSYALVPYILAENPGINGESAIKLSQDMMKGYKWQLFKLDLSFLIFCIIDIFTFHLLSIIFINPYKKCCLAEFYMNKRDLAIKQKIENSNLLCDKFLLESSDTYPKEKFMYKETEKKSWIHTDYNKSYSITSLILMFFATSIFGWCWEVFYHLFRYGSFVNRGTLHGPWLPIYGWGAIILLIVLKKWRKNPILTFLLALLVCGMVEYSTSWFLENFRNARWWDYDGYFLNIKGRICLENLIAFGLGGCTFIYFAAPFFDSIFSKINKNLTICLCTMLSLFYISDFIYSSKYPNMGSGVSKSLTNIQTKNGSR